MKTTEEQEELSKNKRRDCPCVSSENDDESTYHCHTKVRPRMNNNIRESSKVYDFVDEIRGLSATTLAVQRGFVDP